MKSDDGCSARLTPGELWIALAAGRYPRWCCLCMRFRIQTCERRHAELSVLAIARRAGCYVRKGKHDADPS